MDESYIRHTAVAKQNEARRAIEPETEDLQKSDILAALDDVELEDTDGQSVRDLMKEEFDATDVLDRYDDWSKPLHDQAVQSEDNGPISRDEQVIKGTGVAQTFDVDTDRPELEGLSQVKKTVEETGGTGMDDRRDDTNPAWEAVHRATEDTRTQFVEFEKQLDEVGDMDSTLPDEYRLAKKMQQEGQADDLPFSHLVQTARTMLNKDGRRVYISDPAEAPEGVSVHEGPQGGLYYEPNVEQPNAADTMAEPGTTADRGEAVEPGDVELVGDGRDDAYMGAGGPDNDVPWETVDMTDEEMSPDFINQIVEAVTDVLHPESSRHEDRTDVQNVTVDTVTGDDFERSHTAKSEQVEWAVFKVLKEYTEDDA